MTDFSAHIAPPKDRRQALERLQQETFDVLVVGGGINGAGVARDAAMRGLRVALLDKGDFASGTSSKSSKLIHGGVRYLEQGDLRLVRIACRERDLLRRRLAPHLVEPLAFLFPVYRGDPVGFFTLGIGMWLYDLLAVFRNIHPHRMLRAARAARLEPALRRDGLRGAGLYYDCWTDDARLTLETILAAREEGAVVINYAAVQSFLKADGRIVGARADECLSGASITVRARCAVNVAGPWVDAVRRLDDPAAAPCLRLTKGVHIVVPRRRVGNQNAVVIRAPVDQRVLFVIPWGAHDIIGTTDTDFAGSPDDVRAEDADLDYLLTAANWSFPSSQLRPADIVSAYAGLRPLVASRAGSAPSAVSREEAILESASGLISLAGGKLTTYRFVAEEIVNLVVKRLAKEGRSAPRRSRTATTPLPGGRIGNPEGLVEELERRNGYGLSREQITHLVHRYGSRAPQVLELISREGDMSSPLVPDLPDIWAEAAYAVENEMALRPDDILLRRTKVGIKKPAYAIYLADIMKKTLS